MKYYKNLFTVIMIALMYCTTAFAQSQTEEFLPETFDIIMGDDLPYPVTWLSGKTINIEYGKGILKGAGTPEDHFSSYDANKIYMIASFAYNNNTGMLGATIVGQAVCQKPHCNPEYKIHYEYSMSDKKITTNNMNGGLNFFGSGGTVIYVKLNDKTVHSPDGTMPEVTIPYSIKVPEVEKKEVEFIDSGAAFSDLAGQVEVLFPIGYDTDGEPIYDDESWTFAKLNMKLPAGTGIKTPNRGSAILSFVDMTTFVQKEESEIILGKATPDKDNQLKLLAGNLWANVKKMAKDGSMEIEMSQAVAGIKGTTFVLSDDGTSSTLKVIEGTVEFASKKTGKAELITIGETITATNEELEAKSTFDVETETNEWNSLQESMSKNKTSWGIISGVVIAIIILGAIALFIMKKKKKN